MSDTQTFNLIFEQFHLASNKSLWVLDENPPDNCPSANINIEVISNRYDVVTKMESLGYSATFSDFDFSSLPENSYQHIFYRISKEKMLAHHIINNAHDLLSKNGKLIISGAKQEGIKGYIERTAKLYTKEQTVKADKQNWAAIFKKSTQQNDPLDDQNYTQLRSINFKNSDEKLEFSSKPGVFGWNKIDQGSKLLIDLLPTLYSSNSRALPKKALDIGCGYGYLSLHCAKLFNCEITATDNNAAAVNSCIYNLNQHNIKNNVMATNCTQGITERFDLVLCNPPFHTGFGVENNLTDKFLKGAHQCLNDNGIAIFVVNLHIPLERKAQKLFKNVTKISDDKHFKVIVLSL